MKKVLLLNPPCKLRVSRDYYCGHITKGRYYWPQLDLLVLSGFLREGFDVHILDAMAEEMSGEEAHKRIADFAPDVVISVVAAVSWKSDMAFLSEIKQRYGSLLAVSGDYPRAEAKKVIDENPFLDAVILDFTDSEVIEFLTEGKQSGLKNLFTRFDKDGPAIVTEKTFSIPVPRHDLLNLRRYHLPHIMYHPFTMLMTDYGCPFSCKFCYFERIDFKRRNIDNVAEELEFIRSLGIRELLLPDSSFGTLKEHALEVCRAMKSTGGRWSWLCDMRVDAADEPLFRSMKDAGCHTIMLGVETPNENVLEKHNKGINVEQIKEAFALAKKVGLRTLAHFIIGLSGEDLDSLRRLVDFSISLDPDIAAFNVARPAWNTSFRDEVTEKQWAIDEGVEIAESDYRPVWESPSLPREEVRQMRNLAMRKFYLRPSYILKQLTKIRTRYQLFTLIREGLHLVWQSLLHR